MAQAGSPIRIAVFTLSVALAAASGYAFRGPSQPAPAEAPRAPIDAPATPAPAPADPLLAMNAEFRAAYRRARTRTIETLGPVILAGGDPLVLLRNGSREQATAVPPLYHALKAVSHVPLAIYVLLVPFAGGSVDDERAVELEAFRARVVAVRDALASAGFPAERVGTQRAILDRSLEFLDAVVLRRSATHAEVAAFARALRPLLLEDVAASARAQIDAMHAVVSAWRRTIPPEEWRELRVVVRGAHTPRAQNLCMQYFERLLPPPVDDRRLVYAEGAFEEAKALEVLGTCVLDTGVGAAFFDDELRMHRDLLADAAQEYLRTFDVGR